MKITIYGTRGSYPVCNSNIIRYGGNTTCFFIEEKKDKIIVDGGSGIINLGTSIIERKYNTENVINILVTHTHWDHIHGFPFFQPFYNEKYTINVYGADSETMKLQEVFSKQHNTFNHPISFENLKSSISFNELSGGDNLSFDNVNISTYQLNHPGKDLGYKFETDSGVFVLLTDLAPIENNVLAMGMKEKARDNPKIVEQDYYDGLVKFIKGADLVLHDTNFTEDEIKDKRHWGHSSNIDALKLLSHHKPSPSLVLSHHDPFHTDKIMDEIYADTKTEGKKIGVEVFIAKEGGSFII
jgi:phosphoribosyl 1,2-cyclic phosphodiesterase